MQSTVIKLDPHAVERPPMLTIRAARQGDLQQILDMIALHAECHGDTAKLTAADLDRDLFGAHPWITALVAEAGGRLLGYALLVPMYRALEGLRGMELHQIFVRKDHRGQGIGRHLVSRARAGRPRAVRGRYARRPRGRRRSDRAARQARRVGGGSPLVSDFKSDTERRAAARATKSSNAAVKLGESCGLCPKPGTTTRSASTTSRPTDSLWQRHPTPTRPSRRSRTTW